MQILPSFVRTASIVGIVAAKASSSNSNARMRSKSKFGDMFNQSKILPLFLVSPFTSNKRLISLLTVFFLCYIKSRIQRIFLNFWCNSFLSIEFRLSSGCFSAFTFDVKSNNSSDSRPTVSIYDPATLHSGDYWSINYEYYKFFRCN